MKRPPRYPKRPAPNPPRRRPALPKPPPAPEVPEHICEADVAEGLERIAFSEIRRRFGEHVERLDQGAARPGVLRFSYAGNLYHLLRLRMVQSVYLSRRFDVPRPKALLGHQHFTALLAMIAAVRDLLPPEDYQTLTINAAGSDSSVMRRLKDELAAATGLTPADEGDLLIRLRHPPDDPLAWEALVRLSARPLATRFWRVCSREGALNAAIASAMAFLTQPKPDDVFLNMACGTGTLLIERLALENAASATGYDLDEAALDCARQNIGAAGLADRVSLHLGDARALPLPDKSVDALCADLPFGHLVGSHEGNLELYPELLREAARLLKPGGRAVFITHEVRLMEDLLADSPRWKIEQIIRVAQGGLNPRIYVLVRV
ncbi:MAG: methyltransferase domain-containing protein [Chloroflexi bacterium]|nr:methyltransferase domain-containing protein [Chloroflexota bacterium]